MASRAKLLVNYPNIDNRKLPYVIGCVTEYEKQEAMQAFKRICFKDVRIVTVEPIRNNRKPSCIWMVYYQLKNQNIELYEGDSSSTNVHAPSLPEDEQSLSKLYDDITAERHSLNMKVVRKYHTQDRLHAVVEYSPKRCECEFQDFKWATEEPRIWPDITEVEMNLSGMKLHVCHSRRTATGTLFQILPNYIATYIPITAIMIANPCLYLYSCRDMEKIITCSSGQFTRREREIIDAVKIKFSAINIVFYLCWFPNLINGILLWFLWFNLPVTLVVGTWYMMAFTNPLQALFNCLVYRRWNGESEMVVMPWSKDKHSDLEEAKSVVRSGHTTSSSVEEHLPLLQHFRKASINRHADYN